MNLPITTLEDAWGEPKLTVKRKINKYKTESEQSNLLSGTNFMSGTDTGTSTGNLFHTDTVYNGINKIDSNIKILGEQFNSMMNRTSGTGTEFEHNIDTTTTGVNGYDEHMEGFHRTQNYGSVVSITDPTVTNYLTKFNEEYKTNLVNRVLKKHIESPEVETYVSQMSDFEIYMVLLFLCFMLYEKLASIFKN